MFQKVARSQGIKSLVLGAAGFTTFAISSSTMAWEKVPSFDGHPYNLPADMIVPINKSIQLRLSYNPGAMHAQVVKHDLIFEEETGVAPNACVSSAKVVSENSDSRLEAVTFEVSIPQDLKQALKLTDQADAIQIELSVNTIYSDQNSEVLAKLPSWTPRTISSQISFPET